MKRLQACMVLAPLFIVLMGLPAQGQQGSLSYPSVYATDYSSDSFLNSDPPGELILADVLILRPLGIASQIVGLAGSFVSIPFAASSNSGDLVGRKLLVEPFDYTWCRPLGSLDY